MRSSARPALSSTHPGTSSGGTRPVSVVATLADQAMQAQVRAPGVQCVEVRADLVGEIDPSRLRSGFSGDLLYSLRSTAEGGGCADPPDVRRRRLIAAADRYDLIELEGARDLHPELLERIEPERRVLSWRGPATDLAGLRRKFETLVAIDAHLYRLAPQADTQTQALVPLRLLRSLGRGDVVAYARGTAGTWTRVLTARFGAPVLFGRPYNAARHGTDPPPDGELPLDRLLADYPASLLSRAERLYGVIGGLTTMSLAPLVYNTAYRSLGLPALSLPFSTDELPRSLAELGSGLDELGLPLLGATVVKPHKETALTVADEATALSRSAGTASLLIRTRTGWSADNEAAGVVAALVARGIPLEGRPIAVVGCGGGGRAAAAGLSQAGAAVTLVNRGARRGAEAASLLDLPYVPLTDFDPRPFAVLLHATTVTDALPFPAARLDPAAVVFDLNYRATDTALIAAARASGHLTLDGRDMLLAELSRQFHLMTGHDMPIAEVRAALGIPDAGDGSSTDRHDRLPELTAEEHR
jgi:3-dehydroquinate dehydratase / shikimate dehydrogenase